MSISKQIPVDQIPVDNDARVEALDPRQSFAVSAPAGSGKTGLLTQRVLKLLALCDYPEEVLGITFTRKAAREMHQRIINALQHASDGLQPQSAHEQLSIELARQVLARDSEQGWQLLLSPSRLRIQTIDAFCQSLARQLPIAAGAGAYLETRENPSALYRAAVRDLFQQLQNDDALAGALTTLLRHMDNNVAKVESLLVQLLDKRTQWLGPLFYSRGAKHHFEATLSAIVSDALAAATHKLSHCLDELEQLLAYAISNRLESGETFAFSPDDINLRLLDKDSQQALSVWQAIVELCLTKTDGWRKPGGINNRIGFPAPSSTKDADKKALFAAEKSRLSALLGEFTGNSDLLALFTDIRALPNLSVDSGQWQLLESLTMLLPNLAGLFHLHCRKVGECDFSEIAIAASRALGEEGQPSDIALKLDYKIKHILVDEFQDTSLPQLQLLRKLTAGWQAGDGRTLFIVGDAMQSCYGFRDANVGIFIQARTHGIGTVPLKALDLTVNFRSDAKLVDWVNRGFKHILPPGDDINRGAVCYNPAHPSTNRGQGIVEAHGFVNGGDTAQAHYLVELLTRELAASPSSRIAILARGRSHLQDILRELRLARIEWQAQDIDALNDRMAVIDLLSLTRALLDFSDRIAWLSILRAPWCGIDLHDLHRLANHVIDDNPCAGKSHYPQLWGQILHCEKLGLSAQGLQLVQGLREVLRPAVEQKARKPLRQWIEGIWLALGGPAAIANPAERHSPQYFFALLDQHGSGGDIQDWEEFDNALASLYDKSDKNARLQVMTIHKSKGLEFDTVIIPKLDKGIRGDDNPLLLWQEYTDVTGEAHLLIGPLGAVGEQNDTLYAYLKRERTIRQDYEAARLLYVACTRAISSLYLLLDLKRNEPSGEIKPPGKHTLAGHLWDIIKDDIVLVEDEEAAAQNDPLPSLPEQTHILRLTADWAAPAWPRDETLARFRGRVAFEEDNRPDPSPLLNRDSRYVGTVLHRALQRIVLDGRDNWHSDRVKSQQAFWKQQLRQLGMADTSAAQGAMRIAKAVTNTLADTIGRWLLDNNHEDSQCELSLTALDAGYRESVIDRTFIEGGVRWIVDYKTGDTLTDQASAEFLRLAEEQYRPQLKRYADLMSKLDINHGRQLPVKTALYFPLMKVFLEIVP
ncbi:MAG: UvrD-helicase domain-containing protein [Cellvibrionaceae bacterium]